MRGLEGRMDAGEVGRGHWRVTLLSGFGWMFDAMDVGLLSFVVVALAREWGLSQGQVGIAISAGLFGMFVGAAASGTLADRYGRAVLGGDEAHGARVGIRGVARAAVHYGARARRGVARGEHARLRGGAGQESRQAGRAMLVLWGSLVSFFNLGAWGVLYSYTPELL